MVLQSSTKAGSRTMRQIFLQSVMEEVHLDDFLGEGRKYCFYEPQGRKDQSCLGSSCCPAEVFPTSLFVVVTQVHFHHESAAD